MTLMDFLHEHLNYALQARQRAIPWKHIYGHSFEALHDGFGGFWRVLPRMLVREA